MIRTLRGLLGCSAMALAVVMVYGSYGCGSTCSTDADCTGTNQVCNTTTGSCETNTTPKVGCAADADCASGKVCDTNAGKNGKCFDTCTADSDCSEGNKCDTTLKRCVCVADDCTKRDDGKSYGCHSVTNQCEPFCASDDSCTAPEKCRGPENAKHCLNPDEVKGCLTDADCGTGKKCDTSKVPGECVDAGPQPCTDDASCKGNANGELCDTSNGKCVQCLDDIDCTNTGDVCNTEGKCEAPASCTDTKTCYDNDADKSSYCPAGGSSPCKKATLDCTADNKASGNDAWTDGIKNGKGSIIWNVSAKLVTDATSCLDLPSGGDKCSSNADCTGADEVCSKLGGKCIPSCSSDGDCDSGQACNADWGDLAGKKGCVVGIPNGTVEVKFNFYHPSGNFKDGKDDPKNSIVKLHDTRGIATKVSIESGDKTSGVAQFSYCEKGTEGKSYSFFIKDTNGDPSNSGCYTPAQ